MIRLFAAYQTPFWRYALAENISSFHGQDVAEYTATFVLNAQSKAATVTAAYDISPPSDGQGVGLLASFISVNAPRLSNVGIAELKSMVLESYASWYGPHALDPIDFHCKNWAEEPYTGGAYGGVMPTGAWTNFGPALTTPVGRIYWAGTEGSDRWPGFFEGALQAAYNAATRVQLEVLEIFDQKVASDAV
jgi:monoamine oxidase